jgi:hypothetical protein
MIFFASYGEKRERVTGKQKDPLMGFDTESSKKSYICV